MRVVAIACVVLHIGWATAAPSDDVVLAGRDPALVEALRDALAPSRVIPVDIEAPSAIGDLTAASRSLVERENTRSALWLISDRDVTTLVAYDRDVDRVLVRSLAYPTPLSIEHAAVIARSARAMLRALRVEESAASPAPRDPPAASVQLGSEPARLATTAGVAVRLGAPADANAELAIGAIWRPSYVGVAVDVSLSPASDLRTMTFDGTIGDRSICIAGRLPLTVSRRARLAAYAGIALHAIRFSGMSPTAAIDDWRFDPAVRIGGVASYGLTEDLDLGLSLSTDNLLRRQRYEVEGEEVVVMPRLQVAAGILVTLRVR